MICSHERPVTVSDLMKLGQSRDWPLCELAYWIGLRPKDCTSYEEEHRLNPGMLVHHDVALVVRWLDRYPSAAMPQSVPMPGVFLKRLRQVLEGERLNGIWFATALGRHHSIGSRWWRGKATAHPTVRRAIALIDDPDPETLRVNWRRWCTLARMEARLRGTPDLMASHQWQTDRLPREFPAVDSQPA